MDIKIRQYQPKDAKGLRVCINELKNYESQFDEDYLTGTDAVDNLFRDLVAKLKKDGAILVADVKNKVVGFISWEYQLKNDLLIEKRVDTIYVSDIAILPQYRGLGIGESLLKEAEAFAKKRRIKYLKLTTFTKNERARRFYIKANFSDYETEMLKKVSD